ncbi:MAG TPA: heme-binding protein [Chloroflexota bacterium]|jgi:glc operon protein GlcG|nr:heme-binding protein [Chloroflexota bacterium]
MITAINVSLSDARVAVDAILKSTRANERALAIALVDSEGNPVYLLRQDGASPVDVRNAERKAYSAAYIGRDTALWRQQILHDGRTVADWANALLTTIHGGWTLRRASQVIGGLGVSGSGDEDRDEALALKGAEALAELAVQDWRARRDPRPIRDRSAARA